MVDLPYDQFMSNQVVTLAYIIVGILVILGTGKIKEMLRIKEKESKAWIKMGKGNRRTEIPKEVLPNIIKICFKNFQRHNKDSKVLFANKCFPSSIASMLYSVEELSKVIILLPFYKNKENVPEEKVREIFRSHEYRFREFSKYLHESLPSPMGIDFIETMSKMEGKLEQDYKEEMIYVDWIDNHIHDPTYLEKFIITKESDIEGFTKMKFEITQININQVFSKLSQDEDLKSLLNEKNVDIPSPSKIGEIAKSYFKDEKIFIRSEVTGINKKGKIELDSKHPEVNDNVKIRIRKHLKTQYPDYDFVVKLVEKP